MVAGSARRPSWAVALKASSRMPRSSVMSRGRLLVRQGGLLQGVEDPPVQLAGLEVEVA